MVRKLGALNVNGTLASGGLLPLPALAERPRAKGFEAGIAVWEELVVDAPNIAGAASEVLLAF